MLRVLLRRNYNNVKMAQAYNEEVAIKYNMYDLNSYLVSQDWTYKDKLIDELNKKSQDLLVLSSEQ